VGELHHRLKALLSIFVKRAPSGVPAIKPFKLMMMEQGPAKITSEQDLLFRVDSIMFASTDSEHKRPIVCCHLRSQLKLNLGLAFS
jgi:hypothetical protein